MMRSEVLTIFVLTIFAYREIFRTTSELSLYSDQISRTTAIQHPYLTQNRDDDSTGGAECLSLDLEGSMDNIISKHEQIFLLMPPKAGGSTLKAFTKLCTKKDIPDNFINFNSDMEKFLTKSYKMPSIVSSHLHYAQTFVDAARYSTSGTLFIYIHRDETDRVVSAIRHVLFSVMCEKGKHNKHNEIITKNETHCILNEDLVVENVIKQRIDEIKQDILQCKTYNALELYGPNLIFIHYKQVNKLQKLLGKHHCPELLNDPPVKANVADDKENRKMKAYLQLKNENTMVPLADWLDEKKHFLEWTLKLRPKDDCKAKTKHMQTELFNCADETLRVKDGSNWYKLL